MRTSQDIVFGVSGQSVVFDAPEGRPSSVTSVEVFFWDVNDDFPTLTGSGSVETNPNTTIDAASGYGQSDPHLVNVAATTGFARDRIYLVTSADGVREWIEISEIDAGNSVTAKHPLHNTYASADTVQSTRITATIDPSWVADETNLDDTCGPNPSHRVRWVYVVAGVTYVADSYFTLVRYAAAHGIRPQDVEATHPGWLDRLPTDHFRDQGRRLIDEAYRAVKLDLHAIWTDDAMVAHAEVIDDLTRWKVFELGELARFMSTGQGSESYSVAKAAYYTRFDSLARITNKVPIRDSSGAAAAKVAVGITRR